MSAYDPLGPVLLCCEHWEPVKRTLAEMLGYRHQVGCPHAPKILRADELNAEFDAILAHYHRVPRAVEHDAAATECREQPE